MKSRDKYLKIATRAAELAGKHLLKNFGGKKKGVHSRGTHYSVAEDLETNEIYFKFLKKHTPDVKLISEENEAPLTDNLTWLIDPMEGSTNYSYGNVFWATQLCLLKNLEPIVSVVYAPKLEQMFSAVKGKGAKLNGKSINISEQTQIGKIVLSMTKGTKQEDLIWLGRTTPRVMSYIRTIRGFGSTGLELAYTAAGMIDAHLNKGSRYYDYAAGVLIVREAGGVVWNYFAKDWSIYDNTLVAGNKLIANELLLLMRS